MARTLPTAEVLIRHTCSRDIDEQQQPFANSLQGSVFPGQRGSGLNQLLPFAAKQRVHDSAAPWEMRIKGPDANARSAAAAAP